MPRPLGYAFGRRDNVPDFSARCYGGVSRLGAAIRRQFSAILATALKSYTVNVTISPFSRSDVYHTEPSNASARNPASIGAIAWNAESLAFN